jgi:hypothetical protein
MPEESNGNASPSRLDRIERIVEVLASNQAEILNAQSAMQQDLKILLSHQVVMQDVVTKLGEAQKHTDERMNALIAVVDDIVRRQPPPPKQ